MPYSAKEIQSIKELIETLVAEKRIGIELDRWGNPEADYKDVADELVDAIKALDNFPIACVVESAMLSASLEYRLEIFAASRGLYSKSRISAQIAAYIDRAIYDDALLEIPESLFPNIKERRAIFRQHPDFEAMVQRDIDRGRLLADELDDSKERVADMRLSA